MTTRVVMIRLAQVTIDLVALSIALWLSFFVRFDWHLPPQMFKRLVFLWPYIVGLEYFTLMALGVPRYVWRYVGLREAGRIVAATTAASSVLVLMRLVSGAVVGSWGYAQYALVPYGVIAANFMLALLAIGGVRAGRRWLAEARQVNRRRPSEGKRVPTLLVGAGQGGLLVAKEIAGRPELGIQPVGFLDDDLSKTGTVVHGIPVLGRIDSIAEQARARGAKQALITISNAPGSTVRRISDHCRRCGLDVKIIPGVFQLVGGTLNLSIRDVAIEDLLGRDPVQLETEVIQEEFRDHCVLVTGAGGSIGSEICRQLCAIGPSCLVLVERAENALFEIHRELVEAFPQLHIEACIGDVGDTERMEQIFDEFEPTSVFHAAAHKHVPMMEANPCEGVKNNVSGTRTLAAVAHAKGVGCFVMISTDKAVRPTSVMGATKRAAEMHIQALSEFSRTRFVTVRFGNVLGSAGSVIPIFKRQIANGGPIKVTHPEMKRYFMTIPEATQLVLQAATMGRGGEIFILDMGEPVRIVDLAHDLIRLSGLEESEIEIEFSGVRPGEKLFEELSTAEELAAKTRHPKIFVGRTTAPSAASLQPQLDALIRDAMVGDASGVRKRLCEVVPEYDPDAAKVLRERSRAESSPESMIVPAPAPLAARVRQTAT